MSEAPERIWADGNAKWTKGSWGRYREFDNDVEYVRADRIEELEAKLAKAVEAIKFWSQAQEPEIDAAINLMQTTLAELKGEDRG